MTRGQLAIITNEKVITSCEYNGDMYWEGYGKDAVKCLKPVIDFETYKKARNVFNEIWHCTYNEKDECYDMNLNTLDFSKNYFDNWFSDYIYIKNITEDSVEIIDRDKKSFNLKPGKIAVINFGRLEKII